MLGAEDDYLGIIPCPDLVQLQSALVEERFRVQESMHRRLLAVSRQAGMAEVATGVLHNVGNTLNSVNVSATVAMEMVRNSKIKGLEKAAAVLEEKRAELGDFLSNDPKGKLLPEFLIRLASRFAPSKRTSLASWSPCSNTSATSRASSRCNSAMPRCREYWNWSPSGKWWRTVWK